MNEIERRFWFEQIRATLMILVMAVSVSLLVTWFSSAHLDLAARQHMMVLSLLIPMIVTPLGLAYMVRQNVRYLNFHRQVQHHANCDDLTGLANRRSFTVDAAAQLAAATAALTGPVASAAGERGRSLRNSAACAARAASRHCRSMMLGVVPHAVSLASQATVGASAVTNGSAPASITATSTVADLPVGFRTAAA